MLCQWIEGDPLLIDDLDAAKCGRPTMDRHCPWCAEHLMRVFRQDGMSDEAVTVEAEPEPEEDAA